MTNGQLLFRKQIVNMKKWRLHFKERHHLHFVINILFFQLNPYHSSWVYNISIEPLGQKELDRLR